MGQEQARALIAGIEKRSEEREARFEKTSIRWRRIGSGPPLVLVHGGNGSWLHWVRNIDALACHHTVWLPDLPGCGESQELAAPASLERLVQALSQNIDSLIGPSQEIGLAAFSFGSILASSLAAARGGVSRLALLGPTGHGLPRGQLPLKNWRLLPPGEAQTEAHRHNLAQLMLHERGAVDALALLIHREASERARLRSKKISHGDDMRRALDRLQIPVLMAWGEHDPTAQAAAAAQALAQGHPNRRSMLIAGAGHWVQYERLGEVNALLCDWFNEPG
ncbi:MAG: alpha/beta fold hydrolase [Burkholderiales bacterium]|nr:alpha/beta fold hydrolase [Burkholderiales bacterium]